MSLQTRRAVEDVALASEIMQLRNREGFMKRASDPQWRQVRFGYVRLASRIAPFEPRN
jgi:hypothetical protein